jgi:hypothetical protein
MLKMIAERTDKTNLFDRILTKPIEIEKLTKLLIDFKYLKS